MAKHNIQLLRRSQLVWPDQSSPTRSFTSLERCSYLANHLTLSFPLWTARPERGVGPNTSPEPPRLFFPKRLALWWSDTRRAMLFHGPLLPEREMSPSPWTWVLGASLSPLSLAWRPSEPSSWSEHRPATSHAEGIPCLRCHQASWYIFL